MEVPSPRPECPEQKIQDRVDELIGFIDAGKYCVICDKFFTSKKILSRHKKTHSDLKSIHCPEDECDKAQYFYQDRNKPYFFRRYLNSFFLSCFVFYDTKKVINF